MKILADFHHGTLFDSLQRLFEDRLGHELYRPIGMQWWAQGFWAIHPSNETARQFLSTDQRYQPLDGTPPLNRIVAADEDSGVMLINNSGRTHMHKACTLDYFKETKFDILIASVPQHIRAYQELIRRYQPQATLIVQMGNNWNIHSPEFEGLNILASIAPQECKTANVIYYHQEIDQRLFKYQPIGMNSNAFSFINCYRENADVWNEFLLYEQMLSMRINLKSFGGQCRDGNMTGDIALANKMAEADMVWHVKAGGDGFGHVLHNAYAMGRPVITHVRHYVGQLGAELLRSGTCINLDGYTERRGAELIYETMRDEEKITAMSLAARHQFEQVVDYDNDAGRIKTWLENLM